MVPSIDWYFPEGDFLWPTGRGMVISGWSESDVNIDVLKLDPTIKKNRIELFVRIKCGIHINNYNVHPYDNKSDTNIYQNNEILLWQHDKCIFRTVMSILMIAELKRYLNFWYREDLITWYDRYSETIFISFCIM